MLPVLLSSSNERLYINTCPKNGVAYAYEDIQEQKANKSMSGIPALALAEDTRQVLYLDRGMPDRLTE
jgi:hypothetical protein